MKKFKGFALLVVLAMVLSSAALADGLSVSGKPLSTLYSYADQIDAQQRLAALSDKASYDADFRYSALERNPTQYTGAKISFSGTVIQVIEGTSYNAYRIRMSGGDVFYVEYAPPARQPRILEDDEVQVYASYSGTYTYTSTTRQSVTVPACEADLILCRVTNSTIRQMNAQALKAAAEKVAEAIKAQNKADQNGRFALGEAQYDEYARRPDAHENEKIVLTGKVVEAAEGATVILRVAVDSKSNQIVYVTCPADNKLHVLKDDQVTITGTYLGIYTYTSTLGGDISIPSCSAEKITVKNYTAKKTLSADQSGYIPVNKAAYEEFSRNPDTYDGEKIRFVGKVLQVIDGSEYTEYRMQLEGAKDSVFYVTMRTDKLQSRVLEDDSVTVYGAFDGLLTYRTTIGGQITIPSCIAEKFELKGVSKTTAAAKDASGRTKVTKTNYQDYARNPDQHEGEKLVFSAKAIQVMDGDEQTIYRMAVDSKSDCVFFVVIDSEALAVRVLEDDKVTVSATCTGVYSYTSSLGGKITVPSAKADSITVSGYQSVALKKFDDGAYSITKSTYQEVARNPKPYVDQPIRFTGKVLQVVEGRSHNIYRIAIGGNSDCVFYVEYEPSGTKSRILEKDTVTVDGAFYGLYTYSTTLGSEITIPACIADSIKKK